MRESIKITFYILIVLHGIIHAFGFLKAFKLYDFDGLTQPISKPLGVAWLLSCLLFGILLFLYDKGSDYWWSIGIGAVLLSQILIFIFWQDAKMGTLPNVILLLVCLIGAASFNFNKKIDKERQLMLSKEASNKDSYNQQTFDNLPAPVKKWLAKSAVFERDSVENVYLKQEVRMKLKPEQIEWYSANAEQYFTINPPAFNWSVNVEMNPFLTIQGRDRFENGRGEMLMKIWSSIPVVDVKDNSKINQAALQRYLAEIIWFPAAALSSYIKWEYVDESTAKAIMTYNGTTGEGHFHFNQNGDFVKFSTMRYKDSDASAKQYEWIAEVIENKIINGINIPVRLKATWRLEAVDWTWLELELTELEYNSEKLVNN